MNEKEDPKGFFLENYSNKDLKRIVKKVLSFADKKNSIKRKCYIDKEINKKLKEFEEKHGSLGLPEGLTKEQAEDFYLDFLKLQAKTELNFNPHLYFPHMGTMHLTEPGFIGSLTGLVNHGNRVAKEASPFSNEIEKEVSNMCKELVGFKPGSTEFEEAISFITSGGTEANTLALILARNVSYLKTEGINIQEKGFLEVIQSGKFRKPVIILPESSHYSFDKISNILGFGTEGIIRIKSDEHFRMDLNDLKETLDNIDTEKEKVVAVITVFGTTEVGAVDEVEEVYKAVKNFEAKTGEFVWKHLDAAYGGPTVCLDKFKHLKKTFIKYDSITFDPHKLLWVAYGAGSLIIRKGFNLRTVSTDAPYLCNDRLKEELNEKFSAGLYEHLGGVKLIGSQSSEGILSTYLTLKCFGKEGLRKALEESFEKATYLAGKLSNLELFNGKIDVLNPNPDMNLVNFRFIPKENISKEKINKLNRKIFDVFQTKKEKFIVSRTKLKGREIEVQRMCITNALTSKKDIDSFVEEYKGYVEKL